MLGWVHDFVNMSDAHDDYAHYDAARLKEVIRLKNEQIQRAKNIARVLTTEAARNPDLGKLLSQINISPDEHTTHFSGLLKKLAIDKPTGGKKNGWAAVRRASVSGDVPTEDKWSTKWFVVQSEGKRGEQKNTLAWYDSESAFLTREKDARSYALDRSILNMVRGEYHICLQTGAVGETLKLTFKGVGGLGTVAVFCRVALDCGAALGPMNTKLNLDTAPRGWKETKVEGTFGVGSCGVGLHGNDREVKIKKVLASSPVYRDKRFAAGMRLTGINSCDVRGWPLKLVTQCIMDAPRPVTLKFVSLPPTPMDISSSSSSSEGSYCGDQDDKMEDMGAATVVVRKRTRMGWGQETMDGDIGSAPAVLASPASSPTSTPTTREIRAHVRGVLHTANMLKDNEPLAALQTVRAGLDRFVGNKELTMMLNKLRDANPELANLPKSPKQMNPDEQFKQEGLFQGPLKKLTTKSKHKRWFVIRKRGATVEGESISWFKNQQAYMKSKKSSKEVKEYALKGGRLNMLSKQWVLQLQGATVCFEPLDLTDYAFIGTFCEILVDAGVALGQANQSDATTAPSKHVTYRHFGAPGTIKIVLTGDATMACIREVLPDSPAAQTPGLKAEMRIVKINGKSVAGYPLKMVTQRIRDASHPIDITFAPAAKSEDAFDARASLLESMGGNMGAFMNSSIDASSQMVACGVKALEGDCLESIDDEQDAVQKQEAVQELSDYSDSDSDEKGDEDVDVDDCLTALDQMRGSFRSTGSNADDALEALDALRGSLSKADASEVEEDEDDDLDYLLSLQDSDEDDLE